MNRGGSRIFATSKTELSVVVSIGYQPLNICLCPKSPGLALDKILSYELLCEGDDRKKQNYCS